MSMFRSSFWSGPAMAAFFAPLMRLAPVSIEITEAFRRASFPQRAPRTYARARSRYWPHQGERECARRVRQTAKAQATATARAALLSK